MISIKCLCPACADEPAFTYTEQHRHECESRYVAALPSESRRAGYLMGVERHRGTGAAQALREATWMFGMLMKKPAGGVPAIE